MGIFRPSSTFPFSLITMFLTLGCAVHFFFFLSEMTENVVLDSLIAHVQSITLALSGPTLVTSPMRPSPLCERVHSGTRCELCNMNAATIPIFKPFCYCSPLHAHKQGGHCNLSERRKKKSGHSWSLLAGFYRQTQTKLEHL